MFPLLAMEIKELGQLELETLDDESLTSAVVELSRLETMLSAERARLAGEWDRRGAWRATGAKSATAALASTTRSSKAECGATLRLERALRHLPVARDTWRAGEISAAHARQFRPRPQSADGGADGPR